MKKPKFIRQEARKLSKVFQVLKDYWLIFTVFQSAAGFIYWSAGEWHKHQVLQVDFALLTKRVEYLEGRDKKAFEDRKVLGVNYAILSKELNK